ncbi:MAG: fatty acid cis/trans isomerase [Candidatus Riflebacteria bacterium]|nr:fatty acid cis/trans isomerase [Candidatus Riflebacteria bacterium]
MSTLKIDKKKRFLSSRLNEWKVLLGIFLGCLSFLIGSFPETTWGDPFTSNKSVVVGTKVTISPTQLASGAALDFSNSDISVVPRNVRLSSNDGSTTIEKLNDPKNAFYQAGNRNGNNAPDYYYDTIQPIIGRRCTVCHGCENSPCSLKLVSYKGLERGGTQIQNRTNLAIHGYEAIRLKDGPLLASDSVWKDAWQKDRPADQRFNPVAPDSALNGADASQSLIYNYLLAGNKTNKPGFDRTAVRKLEQERYDGGATVCSANLSEYKRWITDNPNGGMPFGCPGLKRLSEGGYAAGELDIIEAWIKKGAPGPSDEAFLKREHPSNLSEIERWEEYLNQPTNKQKLVSRFLYEHLFRAHIHFYDDSGEFYMLLRASNPPGDFPVRELVTNAPNDCPTGDSATATFYYRFDKITDLITAKDHIVWEVKEKTFDRINHLFEKEAPTWDVKTLPGYDSLNPFIYFQQIPPSIRYKFLLDNMRYFMENLVKSPVCNGSKATFAMDDYVWAWAIRPEADPTAQDSGQAAFGPTQWALVNDGYLVNTNYVSGIDRLVNHNSQYLNEVEKRQRILRPDGLLVNDIWDGSCLFDPETQSDDKNPNAWISALRHETNGTVVCGAEAGYPIAVYLFNFTNLERAYFSLSFNFHEWGTLQHKLLTWRDFMHVRLEASDRFISLFDPKMRVALRGDWSSGMVGQMGVKLYADHSLGTSDVPGVRPGDSSLNVDDKAAPRQAFLSALDQIVERRFSDWALPTSEINEPTKPQSFPTQVNTQGDVEACMKMVTQRMGFYNSRIPSVAYIRIQPQGWVYTLVAHRRYASHNFVSDIIWARKGQGKSDYCSIYRGILGDYPNLFFDIPMNQALNFFGGLLKVNNDTDWVAFRKKFMVPKNQDIFWSTVDWYNAWQAVNNPIYGGIFDIREYDNWEIPPESKD